METKTLLDMKKFQECMNVMFENKTWQFFLVVKMSKKDQSRITDCLSKSQDLTSQSS